MASKDPARVIIGSPSKPARSTFMFCSKLQQPEDDDGVATGSSAFLFSKKDKAMYKKVVAAIEAAGKKKFGDKFSSKSRKYSSPLRDGDELYEDEEYSVGEEAKGMWFVSTKCYKVPQLVDSDNERVIDPEAVEEMMGSGNYFLASVTFKAYSHDQNKGVRGVLNNLMFIKEGERLDGSASAEQDFADYAMDDDADDYDDDDDDTPRKKRKSSKKSKKRRRR